MSGVLKNGVCLLSLGVGISLIGSTSFAESTLTEKSLDDLWEDRHLKCDSYLELGKGKMPSFASYDIAWRYSRAIYYGGFFCHPEPDGKNDDSLKEQKMNFFDRGVQAGQAASKLNPEGIEGYYWYAVNYGGYGLNKGVMASLSGADEMLIALTKIIGDADKQRSETIRKAANPVKNPDPNYHFAGPLRVRAYLYYALPWFRYGSSDQALADLRRATEELNSQAKLTYKYYAEITADKDSKKKAIEILKKGETLPDVAGVKEEEAWKRDIEKLWKELK